MADGGFDWADWTGLLSEVVTEEGKVDYARLAERRDRLAAVVERLGAVSPQSDPQRFPSEEHGLAYWLNAYNVFTLAATIAEYPISSVWKTRDGQFFQRRRHLAGGRAVSLDDIEHEVLRGEFAEPRIHFAINCGSNGCPALRPSAYVGEELRETLRSATRRFLENEWNCRVDHTERRIYVSRIFKMYAQDFAGTQGSTQNYRVGVLRFVAQHIDVPFETLEDYEVVYNVYDWGLNDAARQPHIGPILFHEPVEHYPPATPSCASCISTRAISATARAPGARSTGRPTAGTSRTARRCSSRPSAASRPTATSSSTAASRRCMPPPSSMPCERCGPAGSAACSRSSRTA